MDIGNFKDLTNKKFGKLTVLSPDHFKYYKNGKRQLYWECEKVKSRIKIFRERFCTAKTFV